MKRETTNHKGSTKSDIWCLYRKVIWIFVTTKKENKQKQRNWLKQVCKGYTKNNYLDHLYITVREVETVMIVTCWMFP